MISARLLAGFLRNAAHRRRPHVLVLSMPVPAPVLLADALAALPGMHRVSRVQSHDWRRRMLDVPRLCRHAHLSERSLPETAAAMADHGVTPVVITGDIFHMVADLRDRVRSGARDLPFPPPSPAETALADEQLEILIADLIVPWCIDFFAGWHDIECQRFTSDEVCEAPFDVIDLICEIAGIETTPPDILRAIDRTLSTSRHLHGATPISAAARERIEDHARNHPGMDFSEIGLGRPMPALAAAD
jgi:hypothetical protein